MENNSTVSFWSKAWNFMKKHAPAFGAGIALGGTTMYMMSKNEEVVTPKIEVEVKDPQGWNLMPTVKEVQVQLPN